MKAKLICIALLIVCSIPLRTNAQGGTMLLAISKSYGHNELWTWADNKFEKIVDLSFGASALAVSPDGQSVVFSAYAEQTADDLLHGGGQSGPVPTDIWLVDLIKHTSTRLTEQPKQIDKTTIYKNGWLRSRPVWSPDGKFLSWLKGRNDGAGGVQLIVYDVAQHLVNVIADGLDKDASAGGDVLWGRSGIAVNDFLSSIPDKIIRVFSQQGQQIFSKRATNEQAMFWAIGPKRDALVAIDDSNAYVKLDTATGVEEPIANPFWSTSPTSVFKIYGLQDFASLVSPDGETIPLADESLVGLSPDGLWAIYVPKTRDGQDTFMVMDKAGKTTEVQAPGDVVGLVWGETRWYLSD